MTREKVVRLTLLTACIFGFSIYMQKGTWIFPFPLYESAMFAAIVLLYIADKRPPQMAGALALLWALLQLAASPFILEFFVSDRNFQWLAESSFSDFLLLGFILVFVTWGLHVSLKMKHPFWRLLALPSVAAFGICFFMNSYLPATIPLIVWLLCFYASEKSASIHRNIVFVFAFFFLTKHLTLHFMAS